MMGVKGKEWERWLFLARDSAILTSLIERHAAPVPKIDIGTGREPRSQGWSAARGRLTVTVASEFLRHVQLSGFLRYENGGFMTLYISIF